jgi:Lon protease-like protein
MSARLPLFPLNTVLFPGQLLPLHIFEARYRKMIQECLQTGQPFGVVLIRQGEEVGEAAEAFEVGTTARIVRVERLPDGRMNILCVGDARFRVAQTYTDQPYLLGRVDLWPWLAVEPDQVRSTSDRVRAQLGRYLELLPQITDSAIHLDLPDEPAALANIAASVLQIDQAEKQQLLSTESIGDLLHQIDRLLQREVRGQQIVLAARFKPSTESAPFSLN